MHEVCASACIWVPFLYEVLLNVVSDTGFRTHRSLLPQILGMYIAALLQASCKVIIDGAHTVGNLPDLSYDTLHPDAYITNLHKWLCTPKGTAMLWVSPSFQDQVKPLVMSHAEGLGFAAEHLWTGTADLSPWLAVPAAIEVHKRLGLAAEHKHRSSMLEEGVAVLVKTLRCEGICLQTVWLSFSSVSIDRKNPSVETDT